MAVFVDLHPKREFINPNFDHYQLSLDKIAKHEVEIEMNVDVAKPPELNFSSHHAKLYGVHNHVFPDPWDQDKVYFCDREWNISKVSVNNRQEGDGVLYEIQLSKPALTSCLFQVPDAANLRLRPVRFNVSLGFPDKNLALVVNGVDSFYLLNTQDECSNNKWKVLYQGCLPMSGFAHQLIDCTRWREGETSKVEMLVASVDEVEGEEKERHGAPYITLLTWLTLASVDDTAWTVERTRRLECSRPFDYACLEEKGTGLQMVAPKIYKMTEDSVKPIENVEAWEIVGEETTTSLYTWSQTAEELTVHLTIPEGLTKANLSVTIGSNRLELSVKNDVDMIKGDLFQRVDIEESTWTLVGRRLEVSLQKVEPELWPTVVHGDARGELVMTEEQVDAIHAGLEHLTADHWNASPERGDKPYNSQMLEECDAVEGDGVILARIDGESHRVTHKAISSNQYLFTVKVKPEGPSAICLRHDVDGFVWQASSDINIEGDIWEHIGSLNAFGYVMASKTHRRFCGCSEDMSIGVIADSQRHIYIYRQRVQVMSPIRNRKTGVQINSVAKQQVISLDYTDIILGVRITNNQLFVLTEQKLLVYALETQEE